MAVKRRSFAILGVLITHYQNERSFFYDLRLRQGQRKDPAKRKFTARSEKGIEEKLHPGDTLVVTKLDRFARNVTEGVFTIRYLFSKGIRVHVLNVGLLENTTMGNFFITTLLAVAELERCMILERTAAGKEIARTREGYKEGRPQIAPAKIELALGLLEKHSYKKVAEMTGISVATLARYRRKKKEEAVWEQFSE